MTSILSMEDLREVLRDQPYPRLFTVVSGAHLYGFPSPDSDYDLRGVHILPMEMIAGIDIDDETIRKMSAFNGVELDLETHDVKKFFALLLKKNGNVMEQIFSPLVVETSPFHEVLRSVAASYLTRFHAYHYLGLAKKQWELFQRDTPRRVKPLLYVFRVLLSGTYLMQTGKIEPNLQTLNEEFQLPYIPDLIAHKMSAGEQAVLNTTDSEFYQSEYERLREQLTTLKETTHLPGEVSGKDALNDLLLQIRFTQLEVT